MRIVIRALGLAVLGAALSLPLWSIRGAAQTGPAPSTGRPLTPAIAYAENTNTHLMVWAEDTGSGTGLDLYAMRLSATGLPTGRVIPVIVSAGNQSDPALVFNRRLNEFLLVYTDDAVSSGVAPTPPGPVQPPIPGTPQPTPPTLPTPNPLLFTGDLGAAYEAAIEVGLDGEATMLVGPGGRIPLSSAVAGEGATRSVAGASVVRLSEAAVTSASVIDEPAAMAVDLGTAAKIVPAIVADGSGLLSLAEDTAPNQATATVPPPSTPVPGGPGNPPGGPGGPVSGSRDIAGVWLSSYGTIVSNFFTIVSSPGDDTYPDIDFRPGFNTDDYALVWREVVGTDVTLSQMRMRGLGRYFTLDPKRTIVTGVDIGRPSVAADWQGGEWLVVWAETPKDTATRDIFGKRLNSNAFPYRPVFRVVGGAADQTSPTVASVSDQGGYLLSWEERNAADPPDIRIRRLNSNGYPWRPQYALAGGPAFSFAPDLAPTRVRAETLIVWLERNAAGDHEIITARLNRDGRRMGPERVIVIGGVGGGVTPIPPPPNPGQPTPPPLPTP